MLIVIRYNSHFPRKVTDGTKCPWNPPFIFKKNIISHICDVQSGGEPVWTFFFGEISMRIPCKGKRFSIRRAIRAFAIGSVHRAPRRRRRRRVAATAATSMYEGRDSSGTEQIFYRICQSVWYVLLGHSRSFRVSARLRVSFGVVLQTRLQSTMLL